MDTPPVVRKRRRPALSCQECRRRKAKCDGKEPCSHCVLAKKPCDYRPQSIEPPATSVHRPIYPVDPHAISPLTSGTVTSHDNGGVQRAGPERAMTHGNPRQRDSNSKDGPSLHSSNPASTKERQVAELKRCVRALEELPSMRTPRSAGESPRTQALSSIRHAPHVGHLSQKDTAHPEQVQIVRPESLDKHRWS